jgi:ketosteroid isomerase-like protein
MKKNLLMLALILVSASYSFGQSSAEQEIKKLSMDKWEWMADKDVVKLEKLFDDKAKFVHMSGTWTTERELEIIETGSIWYQKAEVHDTSVEISGNTAIVWNRITLTAVVRGGDAVNEFTVTEVYQKQGEDWKMLAMTFSNVRDTHEISH